MKFCRFVAGILAIAPQLVLATTPIPDTAVSACQLKPSRWADISSPLPGVISQVFVKQGVTVNRGDSLVGLDNKEETSLLRLAEERAEFASRKLSRNSVIRDSGLLPEQEADELETESKLAKLEAQQLKDRIDRSIIKAPFSGTVVQINTEVGEKISDEPLLSVANLQQLHAELVIDADWYRYAVVGNLLGLIIQGHDDLVFGKIKTIDPLIDAASYTFTVIVELDNQSKKLLAGQRCGLSTLEET